MMRNEPWNSNSKFDWAFIRKEWDKLRIASGKQTFVEASPPNIARLDDIHAAFGQDMAACCSISSPYFQISSTIKNYTHSPVSIESIGDKTREWVYKASLQRRNVEAHGSRYPLIRYEDSCRSPDILLKAFGLQADRVTVAVAGKKNSKIGTIFDLTAKNLAFLTVFEMLSITEILAGHRDLLDFFGYSLLDVSDYDAIMRDNIGFAHAGLLDRANWDRAGGRKQKAERSTDDAIGGKKSKKEKSRLTRVMKALSR